MCDPKDHVLEIDREYLDEKGYAWECIPAQSGFYIIFKNFVIPREYYSPCTVELLILLPAGYPNASPDMFWTVPDVKLANGNWPTAANAHEQHCGREWQRWSRHNTVGWRAGIDSLRNFMAAIKKELSKGI